MKLSIISPTFNEAANVGSLVEQVGKALPGVEYEILIVDDNSPDLTWSVAETLARANPKVRVIRRMQNPGLGPAVIEGFAAAEGELLACIDADLQHDPAIFPKMLDELNHGAEVVVGSRYVDGGGTGDWTLFRRLESWVATKVAQVFLGVKLKDPMSGYFIMRHDDFAAVRDQLNPSGFKILLEILAKLRPNNMKEVPYTFRTRLAGESKLSSKVVLQYVKQVWRLSKLGRICSGRFLKFAIVGSSGIALNLAVLTGLIKLTGLHDWRVSAVASLAANVSNYVLNNSWTFADRVHRGWSTLRGYLSYLLMSSVGLLVSTGAYAGMTWGFKAITPGATNHGSTAVLLIFQFVGIVLGTFFNYKLNKHITWQKPLAQEVSKLDATCLRTTPFISHQSRVDQQDHVLQSKI
jgi:dolichol-phosphate mannosyltransferase